MVKKWMALLLVLSLCLGLLCGCGDAEGDENELASAAGANPNYPPGYVVESPPVRDLTCGNDYVVALLGTYTWQYEAENGETVGITSDSLHPLDAQEFVPRLNGQGEVTFRTVNDLPDEVSIRAWPDTAWGDTSAESVEVPWDGDSFAMLEGGWIYELHMTWNSQETWGGDAYYSFYGVNTPQALALEEDGTLVKDPPAMTVACGEETFTAARGSGGEWSSEFSESMVATGGGHDYRDPVKERDNLPFLAGEPGAQVTLAWECPDPDSLTVTALSPAGESREVPSQDGSFLLEEGEWVYTVTAQWTSHNKWGGQMHYAFVGTDQDQTLQSFPYTPPKLTVTCPASGEEVVLRPEAHQWNALFPDGTWEELDAAAAHPLEWQEEILWVIGIERVDFAWEGEAPDQVTVQAWPSSAWGETDTPAQAVEADETGFSMLDGEWIYQIAGEWTGAEEWGGQAAYLFFGAPV